MVDFKMKWCEAARDILVVLFLVACFPVNSQAEVAHGKDGDVNVFEHITVHGFVRDVLEHPAFAGFSRLLLPKAWGGLDGGMPLTDIGSLLPYHSHVRVETTVDVLNAMIDEVTGGLTIFYSFYSEQQKVEDPAKNDTGLFFFKGTPNAPFAIVCPGGGFSYVGSIHEGFPLALELSRQGYNAFVLKYRVGSGRYAVEDLAVAMSYIFKNVESLGVGGADYSLWGGSAGARMVASIGTHGSFAFCGENLPSPAAIIMAYTGHSEFSKTDPPTFVVVGADDPIVNVATVERRVNAMRSAGIDVEYHRYQHTSHGFGLGIGTDAEGWIEDAIRFWEKHISKHH